MARHISTALSDAVLAASVVHFLYYVFWSNFFAALGLFVQGVAAAMGTVRFCMVNPDRKVKEYHELFSWLAQIVGLPLLGIGFAHNLIPVLVTFNFLFIAGALVANRLAEPHLQQLIREATSGFGMLTVIVSSVKSINIFGLAGAVLYVGSGLGVGSEGHISGIPRVDILHYMLALGNEFFRLALTSA